MNWAIKHGAIALAGCVVGISGTAQAQSVSSTARVLGVDDREYRTEGIQVGAIRILPSIQGSVVYDSNVYADPAGELSDTVFSIAPQLTAAYATENFDFNLLANLRAVRFAKLKEENSESAEIEGKAGWMPGLGNRVTVSGGFSRLAEDRGEPEALNNPASGPRITQVLFGRLQYRRERGRLLFDASAEARNFNALAARDLGRDFTAYTGQTTVGMRLGGSVYGTVTGFVSRRDFKAGIATIGVNRDATTYGGRVGFEVDSGGLLEGRANAGVFRFEPDDASLSPHSGLSVDASLTYRPRRRTAITLDMFSGDVATFRLGAQSRSDTRVGVSIQQEARHNLFGSAGFAWRQTRFRGTGITERSAIASGEVEWLVNRHVALSANAIYSKRTSDDPTEPFERWRTGITLRLRG